MQRLMLRGLCHWLTFQFVALNAALAGIAPGRVRTAAPAPEMADEKGRIPSQVLESIRRSSLETAERRRHEIQAKKERERFLYLTLPEDYCLAYQRSRNHCLVSVGEFNRQLPAFFRGQDVPAAVGSDKEAAFRFRHFVLNTLLDNRFQEEMLADEGNGDLQRELSKTWREHLAMAESAIGEALLHRLYLEYYPALFGPKWIIDADIMGSSDSSFLDSLVTTQLDADSRKKNGHSDLRADASGRQFQWCRLSGDSLPNELVRPISGLKVGDISNPIRCRFGWFTIVVSKMTVTPAHTYEDALPLLIELSSSDFSNYQADLDGSADIDGADSGSTLIGALPVDTSDIRVWLLPRSVPGCGKKHFRPGWPDTALVSPIRLKISDLPSSLRPEFRQALLRHTSGIIETKLGTWYFVASSRYRVPGHGKISMSPRLMSIGAGTSAAPFPLEQILRNLAEKEKDFRKAQLLRWGNRSQGGSDPRGRNYTNLKEKWLAEDVFLEERMLRL